MKTKYIQPNSKVYPVHTSHMVAATTNNTISVTSDDQNDIVDKVIISNDNDKTVDVTSSSNIW